MNEQQQMAAALAAFGILVFFVGAAAHWKRRIEASRLRQYVAAHASGNPTTGGQLLKREAAASPIVVGLNRRIGRTTMAQKLQAQLVRSGVGLTANHFLLGQVAAAVVLFLLGRYVIFFTLDTLALLLGIAMAIPAFVVPNFVLKFLERRRVSRFEHQLAAAVDTMAGALQAGSSLPQAFELVAREMSPPISEEFGRMIHEASLAVPLDQALTNMLDRVPSMDLDMLVTAINIQYKVGGNLSHILKTISHTIRERVRIRGELNTLTAQARLSSYIISALPGVVVAALMLISPSYITKLFDPGVTRVMLVAGVLGIVSGFYVMKRIATIEV